MQKRMLVLVGVAMLAMSSAASAQSVKNPSGGMLGQAPNFPMTGTATFLNGAPMKVASTSVKNPSGGMIGQAANYPAGSPVGSGPMPKSVKNPSGGMVGQAPNFPAQ
jgi:hypothetical protein